MAKTANIEFEVEPRDVTGKNACRRLRAGGRVPGNVYGLDRPPFKVSVDPKRVGEVLRLGTGANTIFSLRLAGQEGKREAMLKELQRDPVSEKLTHIDFVRVDPTKRVQVNVPIRLTGLPEGVKNEGGILDFVHREVELDCLPANIPEVLEIDISALHINQHVSVSDLTLPEDVNVHEDLEQIIAVVVPPREEVVEVDEEAEAVATDEPAAGKEGDVGDDAGDKKDK